MTSHTGTPPPLPFVRLSPEEVEEFRALMNRHSRVALSFEDARMLSTQLLHVLALIRDVAVSAAMDQAEDVDKSSCQNEHVEQLI